MCSSGTQERTSRMKGKRSTTEDKIRILREAARGEKSLADICREANLSVVSFHRWQRPFGQRDIHEARRLKELAREHDELKQMLAEALVKNETCSHRAAGRILQLARSTFSYQGRPPTPGAAQLRKRRLVLSAAEPRYGYRRMAALLRREGGRVGRRQIP